MPSFANFEVVNSDLEEKALIEALREAEPDTPIVSNSQLNSWDRCELQFSLGYRERWERRETKTYLEIGTFGHDLLKVWYLTHDRKAVEARFNELLQIHFATEGYMPLLATALRLVTEYIDKFVPSNDYSLQVGAVEQHFVIALWTPRGRKYYLHGYIDLAMLDTQTNMTWIFDHKFSSRRISTRQAEMDPQIPRYAAAYTFHGFDVFGGVYNQFNTYDYKRDAEKIDPDKLFKRELIYLNRRQLDNVLIETGRAVDDLAEFLDTNKQARRRLSKECSGCWFQEPCLFGMKGEDMDSVLLADYRKKGSDSNNPQRLDRYPKTGEYREDLSFEL